MKDNYYILCKDEVIYSGTKDDCIDFVKETYDEYPAHEDMILCKELKRFERWKG